MKLAGITHASLLADLHEGAFDEAWSAEAMAELLASPGVFTLIAQDDGAPVAFVMARVVADEGEILTLATRPDGRRRGFGRALMQAAAEMAQARGALRLLLEVAEDNLAACALYDQLGYRAVGKRLAYYAHEGGARTARVLSLDLIGWRP